MTAEELSEIYYINKEIKSLQLELADLKQKNFYKHSIIRNMPRGGGEFRDPNLEYVNSVMELEDMINYGLKKLQCQRKKINDFIESVGDPELRLIMRLRAINNMNWDDIGKEVGMDRRTAARKFCGYFNRLPTM